jgi:hypothetical protein
MASVAFPTVEEFVSAGCGLSNPRILFIAIYCETLGQPCNGCAYDTHGSRCAARASLFPPRPKAAPMTPPAETVREAASRLGVSISEIRRRRAAGVSLDKPPGPPSEPSDKTAVVTEGKGNG